MDRVNKECPAILCNYYTGQSEFIKGQRIYNTGEKTRNIALLQQGKDSLKVSFTLMGEAIQLEELKKPAS
jgi:hypothetical protein